MILRNEYKHISIVFTKNDWEEGEPVRARALIDKMKSEFPKGSFKYLPNKKKWLITRAALTPEQVIEVYKFPNYGKIQEKT